MIRAGGVTYRLRGGALDADLLARWMSEVQNGSLDDLRSRIFWLAAGSGHHASGTSVGRWVRDAQTMCLVEVDWAGGTWRAAPTVITRLPQAGGTALLAGSRPARVLQRLAEADVSVHYGHSPVRGMDLPAPSAVWISYDRPDQLPQLAREIGAHYVPCSALQLAAHLEWVRPGPPAAPPAAGNNTVERYQPAGQGWQPAPSDIGRTSDGLYRLRREGRMSYLLKRNDTWHRTTYAEGVHLVLAATGAQPIRWRADRGHSESGSLFVDYGASLPAPHAAVAALCTGLPPRVTERAETVAFDNVPLDVARRISRTLGYLLEER